MDCDNSQYIGCSNNPRTHHQPTWIFNTAQFKQNHSHRTTPEFMLPNTLKYMIDGHISHDWISYFQLILVVIWCLYIYTHTRVCVYIIMYIYIYICLFHSIATKSHEQNLGRWGSVVHSDHTSFHRESQLELLRGHHFDQGFHLVPGMRTNMAGFFGEGWCK